MFDGLKGFQKNRGLQAGGVAKPGGPTEIALNSALAQKTVAETGGAAANRDSSLTLDGGVGSGQANRGGDVQSAKRALAWAGYYPRAKARAANASSDDELREGIRAFQQDFGLKRDGLLRPGGKTETELDRLITPLVQVAQGPRPKPTPKSRPTTATSATKASSVPPQPTYGGPGKTTTRVAPQVWDAWHGALDKAGASPLEKEVYGRIFAAEGGDKSDGTTGTVSGITQDILTKLDKDWSAQLSAAGINNGDSPASLSHAQRIAVYGIYMNDVIGPSKAVGGKISGMDSMKDKIGDNATIAAIGDTLFREGGPVGGKYVQQAINRTRADLGNSARIDEDGAVGTGTLEAAGDLASDPATRKAFIDNLMDIRNRQRGQAGEITRTNSYRIP